ncbi:NADP-dependent malic enzyme [Patescibacteria group bacterium]|nr:NADP-dependent malic enzyme [Patescibacteria group bacterium]
MTDFDKESFELHERFGGKLEIVSKVPLKDRADLSRAYTPGVAAVSSAIAGDPGLMYKYTPKGRMVAIVSDGSAVLGLGNVGAAAAYPVMEGKCLLFKQFAGIDAFPIVVRTQDTSEIVSLVENICEGFGGINLEDISAPRCFEIEAALKERLDIPVFHDDQHGTAIVALAGLTNALKVVEKDKDVRIVINGAGSAGIAICKLLHAAGFNNIVVLDTRGAIYEGRSENMNDYKVEISRFTNPEKLRGSLEEVLKGADVFIGVSQPGLVSKEMVRNMAEKAIVFALANPTPEIMPDEASEAGAAVVASGRSDSKNQLNNVLVFPGIFRGALSARISKLDQNIFLAAAEALAALVPNPNMEKIIPNPFEEGIADAISKAVISAHEREI